MLCPHCQKVVPDESAFCLACGTRLIQPERAHPVNGGASRPPTVVPVKVSAAAVPVPDAPPAPGGRQAYALSFKPIIDERLRYRVARWVCERAPAHALPEVQSELGRGAFFTFLALTPEEADAARQGIEALGVSPALVHLAPASLTDTLRAVPRKERSGKSLSGKDWLTTLAVLGGILAVGVVLLRLFGGRGF